MPDDELPRQDRRLLAALGVSDGEAKRLQNYTAEAHLESARGVLPGTRFSTRSWEMDFVGSELNEFHGQMSLRKPT